MQARNKFAQTHRIIAFWLLFAILSFVFNIGNVSAIAAASPPGSSQDLDLDEDASQWWAYTEVPSEDTPPPTWEINNVSSPSLDGRSLRCALTGGNPYSNVHCYRNLAADPTSNLFTLSMSFYYRPASTFNNVGGPSIVQALEFTMNKWNQGLRYEWALQWDNVDTGAPKWRYWGRQTPGGPLDWVDLGIAGSLVGQQWHSLELEGEILAGKVHYKRFIIDGQGHPLDILVSPASTSEPDKLAVAVQLDGNSTETPYEVFLDQVTFTHLNMPPGVATLVAPSGAITDTTPTYTWNKVNASIWYYLWVSKVNMNGTLTTVHNKWYESSAVCVGPSPCSITPAGVTLSGGNYRWWIQTWNDGGYGPWSSAKNFSLPTIPPPGAATLVSPSGSITDTTPTYTWNKGSTATWYYLWVNGPSGNVTKQWYEASVVCGASTCSVTPTTTLGSGAHTWWIQTWNDGGYGPWSSLKNFSVSTIAPPGVTTLVSPSGSTTDTTPTYTWNKVNASTWYHLWVSKVNPNGSLTTIHSKWYESSAVCGGTTCSITPPTVTLAAGNYRWWIQTWNEGGYGPWSSRMDFRLP